MELVHIELQSGQISRRHARMHYLNGELFIEDMSSTHGTMVDGREIPSFKKSRIEKGQLVRFACFSFRID